MPATTNAFISVQQLSFRRIPSVKSVGQRGVPALCACNSPALTTYLLSETEGAFSDRISAYEAAATGVGIDTRGISVWHGPSDSAD